MAEMPKIDANLAIFVAIPGSQRNGLSQKCQRIICY